MAMDKIVFFLLIAGASSYLMKRNDRKLTSIGYCKKDGEFEVIMRPPKDVEVELGATVSLVCAAHGHGKSDPIVYWKKSVGPYFDKEGTNFGPVSIGKSVLYIDSVTADDIDTYKCVIEDCCGKQKEVIDIDIHVPDATCEDVYGIGHTVYSAVWQFKLFSEAAQYCEDKGMELALPRNENENERLLSDIVRSFGRHPNAKKYSHDNWIWIAASDAEKEGEFKELKTGKPITYNNFTGQQPDNWTKGGEYPKGQDCAGINRATGGWDDSFSHYRRPFVCLCPAK